MQEYPDGGLQLGELINPEQQRVEIYHPGQTVESLTNPKMLSEKALLPGFVLKLADIF